MGGEVQQEMKPEAKERVEEILRRERAWNENSESKKNKHCFPGVCRRRFRFVSAVLGIMWIAIFFQMLCTMGYSQHVSAHFEIPTISHHGNFNGSNFQFNYFKPIIPLSWIALVLHIAILSARRRYFKKHSDTLARILLVLIVLALLNQLVLSYHNTMLYSTDKVYSQMYRKFTHAGIIPNMKHYYDRPCREGLMYLSIGIVVWQLIYSWIAIHRLTLRHGRRLFKSPRLCQFVGRVRERLRQFEAERRTRCRRYASKRSPLFVKSDSDRFYRELKLEEYTVDNLRKAIIDSWGLNKDSALLILKHGDVLLENDEQLISNDTIRFVFFTDLQ